MNISMTGRQLELTQPIKEYIDTALITLEKYHLDIISVNVVVSKQERNRGAYIEYSISIANKNSIIIKQKDDDLYAAIDLATDRAQKALRRLSDRNKEHYKDGINEAKASASTTDIKEAQEAQEDEIIPVELELYKPQEVADVLEYLKESNKQFEIFLDIDGKTRVLYKRNDGKFGLY